MKVLAFLFSVLLGGAVLIFFLRPWEGQWADKPPGPKPVSQSTPVSPPEPRAPAPTPSQTAQTSDPEAKPTLLMREQAEAAREAALKPQGDHALTPETPTKRYFKVKVLDAGTLEIDQPGAGPLVIRIDGIEARSADETCKREDGGAWPCGAKAKAALTLFVRARAVTCTLPRQAETGEFAARCSVKDQDLATWLVRRGWALPKDDSETRLADALKQAKSERLGLWESE